MGGRYAGMIALILMLVFLGFLVYFNVCLYTSKSESHVDMRSNLEQRVDMLDGRVQGLEATVNAVLQSKERRR